MRAFKFILIISLVINSCGNAQEKIQIARPKPDNEVITQISQKAPSSTTWFQDMKSSYIEGYNEEMRIDTILVIENDTISFSLDHYCSYDSTLIVPLKYLNDSNGFITHSFSSKVEISRNNELLFDTILNKEIFRDVITKELEKYGVLRNPYFRAYEREVGVISIGYSISIPLTDIGAGANLKFILNDKTILPESR